MKKLILTTLFLIVATPLAYTVSYLPTSTNSIPTGIGVCAASDASFLYAKPDTDSDLKEIIKIKNESIMTLNETLSPQGSFLIFMPSSNSFFYVAKDEEDGWCNVIYNKASNESGWIQKTSENDFMTWKEFFYKYGKENGLYFLNDVPVKYKKLRTNPDEEAQVVKDCVAPTNISFLSMSGNWVLVRIIDFGGEIKIGWTRWKGDSGEIYVLPQF